jgi:hypothetical protein
MKLSLFASLVATQSIGLSTQTFTPPTNRVQRNIAPNNNQIYSGNPALYTRTVSVSLCVTQLQLHTSDSDNWLDWNEEWDMKVGIIGVNGNPIETGEMSVPVKLQNANLMVNINKCQEYIMNTDEAQQLIIYSDGVERDGGLNQDDPLPSGQAIVGMEGARLVPQRITIQAGDSAHAYTLYGVVKYRFNA